MPGAEQDQYLFGDVVSVLIAVKTADGSVLWIAGESDDVKISVHTPTVEEWPNGRHGVPRHRVIGDTTATVHAAITKFAGDWKRGVPDVRAELEAGAKALPPGDVNDDLVRVLPSSFGPNDNG
jgi:hypothetical protein